MGQLRGKNFTPAPELFGHPVRKKWARQLVEYGPSNARWRRALHGERTEDARIGELLSRAQDGTHFYAEAFRDAGIASGDFRSTADLAHFPAVSRATLQARYYDFFHRDVGEDAIEEGWLGRSSGSTGEPVRFFMDARSIHFFTAFIRFLWERHSLGRLPLPGRTGIALLCTLPRSAIYGAWMPLFRFTRFRKLHWGEPNADETLAHLAPSVITGDPDSLAVLADALEDGLRIAPKLVLSSAFALPQEIAERIRRASGAIVVDYYSMAETGPIAWRCERGTLHVLEGAVELESHDGELVLTNLRNRFFPLIRYRTGDLGRVDERTRCACGASTRSIERFDGRVSSRFLALDGRRVDPSQLAPVLSSLPVAQFALEQTAHASARLRYHGDAALDASAARAVEAALSRLLGNAARVEMVRSETPLRRSGEKPIVFRSDLVC